MTAVRSLDIVARTVALSTELGFTVVGFIDGVAGNVGNLLVTGLTP